MDAYRANITGECRQFEFSVRSFIRLRETQVSAHATGEGNLNQQSSTQSECSILHQTTRTMALIEHAARHAIYSCVHGGTTGSHPKITGFNWSHMERTMAQLQTPLQSIAVGTDLRRIILDTHYS